MLFRVVWSFAGLVLRSDRPGPLRNKPSNTFALILEHHPGQTLKDAMKHDDPADAPSLVQRVAWALQIARGMAYLHRRCKEAIVHGALRPSNILIARNGNAVISNFGLARIMRCGAAWRVAHNAWAFSRHACPSDTRSTGTPMHTIGLPNRQ